MTPRCLFNRFKYGRDLTVDARPVSGWTGIVPAVGAHTLDFQEVLLVHSGRGTMHVDQQTIDIQPETILVTPPNLVRTIEVLEPIDADLVVFVPDGLDVLLPASCVEASGSSPSAIFDVAGSMCREIAEGHADMQEMLDTLVSRLAILLRRSGVRPGPANQQTPPLLRRLESVVDLHFRTEHRPHIYADRLHVTLDHLSAVTRASGRGSVTAVIRRRVIKEAKRLLGEGDMHIAGIAFAIGFDDPSHFSRVFKRITGTSPSEFRRRISETAR